MKTDSTRINPIKKQNQIKTVGKLENGDLTITLNSGHSYTISQDDELFQTFAIWSIINQGF